MKIKVRKVATEVVVVLVCLSTCVECFASQRAIEPSRVVTARVVPWVVNSVYYTYTYIQIKLDSGVGVSDGSIPKHLHGVLRVPESDRAVERRHGQSGTVGRKLGLLYIYLYSNQGRQWCRC